MVRTSNSSFKDPDGFIFSFQNSIYRQVNISYKENYEKLINSGLYEELQKFKLLIPHTEVKRLPEIYPNSYKILKPNIVPFISYPYEWSFSELKDAALTTLEIQKISLKYRMTLKDANAYNIQFSEGKPTLIDTLSFEQYVEGEPWKPYRQFCQHFLAPLALISYGDLRLTNLLRTYIDGIPLDLAAKLLPYRTFLSPSLLFHIHLHAKAQSRLASKKIDSKAIKGFNKNALSELIESLGNAISRMSLRGKKSVWLKYYQNDSYNPRAFEHKAQTIKKFINFVKPKMVWDLGSNVGTLSRLASSEEIETIAFDNDPILVEENYLQVKENNDTHLLPLVLDLTNPSPSQGFATNERLSLMERGPVDMIFALALIHHLAIGNNITFAMLANFFAKLTKWLAVEFIPKTDKKVKQMLYVRKDIFYDYNQKGFEEEFGKFFKTENRVNLRNSQRSIYLMEKR